MNNKILCLVCSGIIYSASYSYAQKNLSDEVTRQITQIAAKSGKTRRAA